MANYTRILKLVEEVRGLLGLEEAKMSSADVGDEGTDKKIKGKFKAGTAQNPFKYLKKGKKLGPAVRGSDRNPGSKKGYWSCRCHSYKCLCKGSQGEKKVVLIDRGYKKKYNRDYTRWRDNHAGTYAPGKTSKFMKRPTKKFMRSAKKKTSQE